MNDKDWALITLGEALGRCMDAGIRVWVSPFHGGDRETTKAAVILEEVGIKDGRLVLVQKEKNKNGSIDGKGHKTE